MNKPESLNEVKTEDILNLLKTEEIYIYLDSSYTWQAGDEWWYEYWRDVRPEILGQEVKEYYPSRRKVKIIKVENPFMEIINPL